MFFSKIIEYLVDGGGVGLYCVFFQIQFFQEEFYPPLLFTFLWVKIGPFTLENHIHLKALKMQGFPHN